MSLKMESPLFPCTEEEKEEIRRELGLKVSVIEEDINAILEWFAKQPHLVDAGINRAFIERMLILCKGSREQAKRRIDNYYKHRGLIPEIIQKREEILSDSEDLWQIVFQIATPKLYKGYRISMVGFLDPDPSAFSLEVILKNTFMISDIRMHCDYVLGDIWILDMKSSSAGHALKLNPIIIQKVSLLFYKSVNLKIEGIHIINATSLLQPVLNFLKPFFNPKIFNRIIVHDTLEDLQEKVPKMYLPKDYGGEQLSVMELKDLQEKELRNTNTKQFLINASNIVSDETKRPQTEINTDYQAGSFKNITID